MNSYALILAAFSPETNQLILDSIGWILTAVVLPFLVIFLRAKAAEAAARASAATTSENNLIVHRIQSFLFGTAAAIAEKRLPVLAKDILKGDVRTQDEVRARLDGWGDDLKAMTQQHFKVQDVDVIAKFGEAAIKNWIERAANESSPFPGLETSKVLLQEKVSKAIVEKGVEYVKMNVFEIVDPEPGTQLAG